MAEPSDSRLLLLAGFGATSCIGCRLSQSRAHARRADRHLLQRIGFGKVAPKEVFNGGDPTGLVTSITWHDWGKAQAVGTGPQLLRRTNQPVAEGKVEPVRIVAFDLGTCNGRYMYAAVEWYFPQHGQKFDPGQFEDVCIGAYYPLQAGQYTDGAPGAVQYQLTLSGKPGSLSGSLSLIAASGKTLHRVFSFRGHAAINGSLALTSTGPYRTGHTFKGTWQTLGMTLGNCALVPEVARPPPNRPAPSASDSSGSAVLRDRWRPRGRRIRQNGWPAGSA